MNMRGVVRFVQTRRVVVVSLFVAVHVFVTVCAHSEVDLALVPAAHIGQASGNIEVWAWSIAAGSIEKLIPSFNGPYPNVHVNLNMTGTNLLIRLMLSLSAGMGAPDVSQIEIINAPRYALTGRVTDLSNVASQYAQQFAPAAWGNCVLDGKVYAIPWDIGPCAIFYRRSLFARYAIEPDKIETWADYIAAGKLVTERSGGTTKMLFLPTNDLANIFEILLQQNSGQIFDDAGRIAVNSPESIQVMNVLRDMLSANISANTQLWSSAFMASFAGDTVASYPMAAWLGGFIKDNAPKTSGDWGVFRLPAITPGGLRTSANGGSVMIIPTQCKNKAAAWAFVQYVLCTPSAQIEHYRNFDLFPALLSTYSDPFFDEPDPFYGGQKVRRLFCQDIEKVSVMNRTKDWREARRYIVQALSHWATNGAGPPEVFLKDLALRLSQRLGREIAPAHEGKAP